MQTPILSLVVVLLAPPASSRFVDNGNGTLTDSETQLVWTQADNGEDVNWNEAETYCQELETNGHKDWRLGTLDELAALYAPDTAEPGTYTYRDKEYPLKIDSRFQLTGPGVWSSTILYERPPTAWSFFFSSGRRLSSRSSFSNYQRVLCVRE